MAESREPSAGLHDLARVARRLRDIAPRERDVSINGLLERIVGDARRQQARLGSLIEAWEAVLPPALTAGTRLDGLRGGCLHVIAASPSVAWSLDRALRGGAEALLRQHCRGALVRVRVTVGEIDGGADSPPPPSVAGGAPPGAARASRSSRSSSDRSPSSRRRGGTGR